MPPKSSNAALGQTAGAMNGALINWMLNLCKAQSSCAWHADPLGNFNAMMAKLESPAGVNATANSGRPVRVTTGLLMGGVALYWHRIGRACILFQICSKPSQ